MLRHMTVRFEKLDPGVKGKFDKRNGAIILSDSLFGKEPETLLHEMIHYYIEEFNPLDKAGSYGIQELPPNYLDKYEGSFENIVGLCPESVKAVLTQLEYH